MTKLFAKAAVVAAIVAGGLVMMPAATFAGTPFVFGGPGYQPSIHAAVSGARAYAAVGAENGPVWVRRARERDCMRSPASVAFEPCYSSH